MAIRRYWEFDAWKLGDALRREVFRLLKASPDARRDQRFRSQLVESARGPCKHIAEGFLRNSPAMLITYLNYAAGSIGETEDHLRDGILLDYFPAEDCQEAFTLATRCLSACIKLKHSQERYRDSQRRRQPPGPREEPDAESADG
jgi:four helix bundle protein